MAASAEGAVQGTREHDYWVTRVFGAGCDNLTLTDQPHVGLVLVRLPASGRLGLISAIMTTQRVNFRRAAQRWHLYREAMDLIAECQRR
jgi:hypothetical protein